MAEAPKPPTSAIIQQTPAPAPPTQLPLPGIPQPAALLQGRFVVAAQYASLLIQVSEHLFPDQKLFALSQDQRRIVDNETTNLLLQARWKVESRAFAEYFAAPQAGVETAPPGTVLGEPVPARSAAAPPPGQYL